MLHGYAIIIKRNGEDGSKFPLTAREIRIGTSSVCDIIINTPFVSKEHCALKVMDDGRVHVKSLSSKSTIVNDIPLLSETALNHEDVLDIGGRLVRWEYLPTSKFGALERTLPVSEKQITPKSKKKTSNCFGTPLALSKGNSAVKRTTPQSGGRISKLLSGRKSLQTTKLLFSPVNQNRRKSDAIRKLQSSDLLQIARVTKMSSSPIVRADTPLKRLSPNSKGSKGPVSSQSSKLGSIDESYSSPLKGNISITFETTPASQRGGKNNIKQATLGADYSTPPEVKTPVGSPRGKRSGQASPGKAPLVMVESSINTPPEVVTPLASPAPTPSKRSKQPESPKKSPKSLFKSPLPAKLAPTTSEATPLKQKNLVTPVKTPGSAKSPAKSSSKKTPAKRTIPQKSPRSLSSSERSSKFRVTPAKSPRTPSSSRNTPARKAEAAKSPNGSKTVAKGPTVCKSAANSPVKTPVGTVTTAKSPVGRKTPAKSPTPRKTPAKSPSPRKTPAKSPSPRKTPAKSPSPRKTPAKTPATTKSPASSPIRSPPATSKARKTPKKNPTTKASPRRGVPLVIAVPAVNEEHEGQLKGQIKLKMANILSNTKSRAKNKGVILNRKLVKKAIKVSTRKPRVLVSRKKAAGSEVVPPDGSGTPVPSLQTQFKYAVTTSAARRVSKRNKAEVTRPDYTELSPRALGLTPRLSPTAPVMGIISPNKSVSFNRKVSIFTSQDISTFQTPDISQDVFVSPLSHTQSRASTSGTPKSALKSPINGLKPNIGQATPFNDFSKFDGVGKLLRTPRAQKSPKNDLRDVPEFKNLLKTPLVRKGRQNNVPKSPRNDLTDVRGVKEIFAASPTNDLTKVVSIRRLVKTPPKTRAMVTKISGPEVKFIDISSRASKNTKKSPKNDLSNVAGVKRLFSPIVLKSPRNDLTKLTSIRVLMKTPPVKKPKATPKPVKSPRNDLTNVNGVRMIFQSPKEGSSPVLEGVKDIFLSPATTPKSSPIPKRVTRLAVGTPVGRTRAAAGTPIVATPPVRATRARKVTAPTESAPEVPSKVKKLAATEDQENVAPAPTRRNKTAAPKEDTPVKTRTRRKAASPDQSITEKKPARRGRAAKATSPESAAIEEPVEPEASKPRGGKRAVSKQANKEMEATSPSPKKRTRSVVVKAASLAKKTRATRTAATKKTSPSPKRTRSRTAATKKK